MKIAINKCYGGFGLSNKATELYLKKIGKECFFYKQTGYAHEGNEEYSKVPVDEDSFMTYTLTKDLGKTIKKIPNEHHFYYGTLERDDKILIETIEELGEEESSGQHADISIVDIPDDVEYEIDDYDGIESVHEQHRSW